MDETCPRCGSPVGNYSIESCAAPLRPWSGTDETRCKFVALGRRLGRSEGIDEGVRLAKEHAGISFRSEADDAFINWSRVNKAAAKAKGKVP